MARPRKKLDEKRQGRKVLERIKKETSGWKRERLVAIKMGLEGQRDLEEIAQTIGRARSTIQKWFDQYRQGGLEELLVRKKQPGAPVRLPAKAREELTKMLGASRWRTMNEARDWLSKKHGIKPSDSTMYRYLKKAGGKLKVPRPRHVRKNEEASERFKQEFYSQLENLCIPTQKSVRLWVVDEMRYGLRGFVRRVWGLRGVRPIAPLQQKYKWGYVYGGLDCTSGAAEFLYTPTVNLKWTEQFLKQLHACDANSEHIVVWDGAGFHPKSSDHMQVPEGIHLISLPPYSPELNPIEKLWDIVQDGLCNTVFPTLEELEKKLTERLQDYWKTPQKVWRLLGDGYLLSSANAT